MGKLTATKIKGIKPTGEKFSIYDGDYLHLFVSAKGKKVFYFKGYRFNGKPISQIKLGTFNDGNSGGLTLAQARGKVREIISTYESGTDYGKQLRDDKRKAEFDRLNTLAQWSTRWVEFKRKQVKKVSDHEGRLKKWILPQLGNYPLTDITLSDVKALYQHVERYGSAELVKRCHLILNGIYALAISEGAAHINPTFGAKFGISAPEKKHLPATTQPKDIGQLLRDMDSYNGITSTKFAYRLIPYLMLRPGELVALRWENIDFDAALIRIDGEDMKKGLSHLVPMATQVIDLMRLLQAFSGDGKYLFPNRQGKHHINRDTLSKGLRAIGYQGKHTPHGFRSTASTNLYEAEYDGNAIEKQLAHTERNEIKASYNRDSEARYLKARRQLMQEWADTIDKLRDGNGDPTTMTQQLNELRESLQGET